jgi:uncharacterized protein YodC (DUF2158 family)
LQKFADGAIVRIEDGPEMTVLGYGEFLMHSRAKQYLCRWLDKRNDPLQGIFAEADLLPASAGI